MHRFGYDLLLLGLGIFVAIAEVAAVQRNNWNRLWFVTIAVSGTLLLLGLWDWRRQSVRETPLLCYYLLASVPTALAAVTVIWLRRKGARTSIQLAVACFTFWVACIAALLLGMALE